MCRQVSLAAASIIVTISSWVRKMKRAKLQHLRLDQVCPHLQLLHNIVGHEYGGLLRLAERRNTATVGRHCLGMTVLVDIY